MARASIYDTRTLAVVNFMSPPARQKQVPNDIFLPDGVAPRLETGTGGLLELVHGLLVGLDRLLSAALGCRLFGVDSAPDATNRAGDSTDRGAFAGIALLRDRLGVHLASHQCQAGVRFGPLVARILVFFC